MPSSLARSLRLHRVGEALDLRRVVVVRKVSAIEMLDARPDAKLTRALRDKDPLTARVVRAHLQHQATAARVEEVLRARKVSLRVVPRLTVALAKWADLIITVGGDGTFLAASHAVVAGPHHDGPPMLGVNSAPSSSVGYFCCATEDDFAARFEEVASGRLRSRALWRMQVTINREPLPVQALNDVLLAHSVPAETTRYVLATAAREQDQKSSGIWVSTAAGSTAAIRAAGGHIQPLDSRCLQYIVREPMAWNFTGEPLVGGEFDDELVVTSRMLRGALYIDGGHLRRPFGFGDRIVFAPSDRPLAWLAPADIAARR